MIDFSENSCYLKVVRPPTKSIKHCMTGDTQVERVSFERSHSGLQYSIKHSKMLNSYRCKFPYTAPFQPEQITCLVNSKEIMDQKSRYFVGKILRELHCALYAINFIQSESRKKYDSTDSEHEAMLLSIWKNLKPTEKLVGRISKQWIDIGFQVEDPATDFRGAGKLGLINLHRFTESPLCKPVFQVACSQKTEYFFASAGLFFTMMALELMNKKALGYEYWEHTSEGQILSQFQKLYQTLFCLFNQYWLEECPNKSIMYFNQNMKAFSLEVSKWDQRLLRAKILSTHPK